jgi:hypothetical protein
MEPASLPDAGLDTNPRGRSTCRGARTRSRASDCPRAGIVPEQQPLDARLSAARLPLSELWAILNPPDRISDVAPLHASREQLNMRPGVSGHAIHLMLRRGLDVNRWNGA